MDPSYSKKQLRAIARDARHRASEGVTKNMCDVVSNEFAYYVESRCDIDIPAAQYAPFGGSKHFVAAMPADVCRFTEEEGYVLVDATLQQFEEKVDEELPDVAIVPPSDPRRERWYDTSHLTN